MGFVLGCDDNGQLGLLVDVRRHFVHDAVRSCAFEVGEHGAAHFEAGGGGLEYDYGVVGLDEGGGTRQPEREGRAPLDGRERAPVDGDDGVGLRGEDEDVRRVEVLVARGDVVEAVERHVATANLVDGEYLFAHEVGIGRGLHQVVGAVDGDGFGGVDDGVVEVAVGGEAGGADAVGLAAVEAEEGGASGPRRR